MNVRQKLQEANVRYVRILWCDNANIIRAKAAHVRLLSGGLPEGVGISYAQQALPVMYDSIAPDSGLGPVGEARLVPDWATLTVLPYAPGQAQVIGDMRVDGAPWAHCPRQFLRDQILRLEQRGLTLNAAFENEFYLLQRTEEGYRPADTSVYAATLGFNRHQAFMLDVTSALEAQGLEPEFYYPESGPGQQELSIRYATALAAADRQLTFRETVRGVAEQHGLVACFLPKVFEHSAGSGCHINISLWREDQNATGDAAHPTGISSEGRQFIAGILEHLHALSALTIPAPNSYRRIRPHVWAGAYRAWGYDNREAAVRVTRGSRGCSRFELKTADASANPYLALGALIAAGLDGLERQLTLPPEVQGDPALLSEHERQAGSIEVLPQSLAESLAALEQDRELLGALGEQRARAFIAVRRAEWEALKDTSLEDERLLLAERY